VGCVACNANEAQIIPGYCIPVFDFCPSEPITVAGAPIDDNLSRLQLFNTTDLELPELFFMAVEQGFDLAYNGSFTGTLPAGTVIVRATVVNDAFTTEGYPYCDIKLQVVPAATATVNVIGLISTDVLHHEVVASGSYSFTDGAVLPSLKSDLLQTERSFLILSAPDALDLSFNLEQVINSTVSFRIAAVWCTANENPTPASKFGPWEALPVLNFQSLDGTSSSTLGSTVEAASFVSSAGACFSIKAATVYTSNPTADMFRDVYTSTVLHDIVVEMRPPAAFAGLPPSIYFHPVPASLMFFDINCMFSKGKGVVTEKEGFYWGRQGHTLLQLQ
jgi:hypothetical protein